MPEPDARRVTAAVLVELLLAVLCAGTMEHRLVVAEAILLAACDLGADREVAGALLEAINGGEVERITTLANRVVQQVRRSAQPVCR